jgi:hypothetical protein
MLSVRSLYRPTRHRALATSVACFCGLAGVALTFTGLPSSLQPAAATSPTARVQTYPQTPRALASKAIAAIEDARHEVLGDALRCFHVRGGRVECGFAVVIRYEDGAVRTCAGSLVAHHHRARFRAGLSCRLSTPIGGWHPDREARPRRGAG